ncbi:hypothetical protein HOY82DRAFT_505053, partial [Tuber indicum]
MKELKAADAKTLYAQKGILDLGTDFYPDVPWDSFASSTVKRFLEYCNKGDYRVPRPVRLPLATPTISVVRNDGHADGVFRTAGGHPPRGQSINGRVVPQNDHLFCSSCATIKDDDAEGSYTGDDSGSSGNPHGSDYFAVFLAHAELYILSQTQGRSWLEVLCLDRLREAIEKAAMAPVRPRFAKNLSDLLSHVYNVYRCSNIKLIDNNQAQDLQNLVSSYAAMHINEIKEECSLLMRYGGEMAEDLVEEVANRAMSLQS